MLSAISKIGNRTFIIDFFLPTLLAVVVSMMLFGSLANVGSLLEDAKNQPTVILLVLVGIWIGSLFLTIINQLIYRCLEGYYPPLSLRRRTVRRMGEQVQARRTEAMALDNKMDQANPDPEDAKKFNEILEKIAGMPPSAEKMLPTRFGNAIRAFELYPNEVYGADGVALWLHAASVAPAPIRESVADARSIVDFMVNCAFFSFIIGLSIIGQLAHLYWYGGVIGSVRLGWLGGLAVAAFVGSYLFYLAAVALVPVWGQVVKACFDLGLPALAKQIGYELPPTDLERRKFWNEFGQTVIYRSRLDRSPIMSAETWLPAKAPRPNGILARVWRWLWSGAKE